MEKAPDFRTARDTLLKYVKPVPAETIPLDKAYGRVLARDLTAEEDVPAFDRSPYDGYAFRAADTASASEKTPVTLRVIEEIPAGKCPAKAITPGTAAKILTGAPIPEGADAVRMKEKTVFTADAVTLFAPAKAGENIIYAGEDVKKGALLAPAGSLIDAGILGTLAAQGDTNPAVRRRVRIGVISTGSEVVEPDAPAAPGQIRNSNRYTLSAALRREGLEPVYIGLAGDDTEAITSLIRSAAENCDAVILTGGVSVGDYDLTPAAMEAAGCAILFRGADIKPGMACAYGMLGAKPVCALSGNPASSLTNFLLIALPALKALAGRRDCIPQEITLTLLDDFGKKSPSTRILRGRLELHGGIAGLHLPGDQGNVVLSSTIGCNALAVVPAGSGPLSAGTKLKGYAL